MPDVNLEDREEWDEAHRTKRSAVKKARAIVSVAFSRGDFDEVTEAARRFGMKTSEFIRTAALSYSVSADTMIINEPKPVESQSSWTVMLEGQEKAVSIA